MSDLKRQATATNLVTTAALGLGHVTSFETRVGATRSSVTFQLELGTDLTEWLNRLGKVSDATITGGRMTAHVYDADITVRALVTGRTDPE